jgi:hypothetical protein
VSLATLALTSGRSDGRRHHGTRLALVVLAILVLELFNPLTSNPIGALATLALYAAILAPLFWVPRLALDITWFRRVVIIVWAFQSLSALVGALQVYFPGVFQSAAATSLDANYLSALQITLANGEEILRPSGLTDAPGAAAAAGTYAILLGLGLWTNTSSRWFRLLLAASIGVGMFVLYICQIRSLVIMVAISILVMATVHALTGRMRSLFGLSTVVAAIAGLSFLAAISVGGAAVTDRLATLTESSPGEVYYAHRGIFLEQTLTSLVPEYPFGAGLARWGMIFSYFGDAPQSLIYVEIQWTGWLLDGGIQLILVYTALLGTTLWSVWTVARKSRDAGGIDLAPWAAMILGYDVGTIALTFNFPVFISAFGMDFWLLNSALLAIAANKLRGLDAVKT